MPWWRGSASSPTSSWLRRSGWRWITAFGWTAACARAIPTSTRRGMSPTSTTPPWISASASSTKTTPTRWAARRARRWVSYDHLPSFYSDLFELGFEAVGEVDARLETVADWKEPYREGVVYYLRDGRVRGVLLWNVWEQVESARKLIAEAGPFRADDLRGLLPK